MSTVVQVPPPEARRGKLKALGGSTDDNFNNVLASQVSQALWMVNSDANERVSLPRLDGHLRKVGSASTGKERSTLFYWNAGKMRK